MLKKFLTLKATRWLYSHGVRNAEVISPKNWSVDQYLLDRPGNGAIQLQLFDDDRSNLPHGIPWEAYFRAYQPLTLVVWGQHDAIFPPAGVSP